jgi:hypothetical protein
VFRLASKDPHGLNYSLTLHGPNGERLAGFDNAHSVKDKQSRHAFNHRHRLKTARPYEYKDAATLLADFWTLVDAVLREKGILS